jgi:hypothetical protein
MKQFKPVAVKRFFQFGLLAATALSATACVVEPAYGPAYPAYYEGPAYVGPVVEYRDGGRWHGGYHHRYHGWH